MVKINGKRLARKNLSRSLVVVIILGALFVVTVLPIAIYTRHFITVQNHVNNDTRNQTTLTYAEPNVNNSLGWSIVEYHWNDCLLVNWEQVNLFLNDLDYYGEQAYWCTYYQIAPDDNVFYLLIWFQKTDTDFTFLYFRSNHWIL